jgi:hypothetical protein
MPGLKIALTAFLSHKYKAPAVNEYFFRLLWKSAHVEFEVDVGSAATNVTRLERLVRDADGFVGIYPFDELLNTSNPAENDLINASKYFRLELDIAARARKPGLVFVDSRFRGIVTVPVPLKHVGFDVREIVGGGKHPSSPRFAKAFEHFSDSVAKGRAYALADESQVKDSNLVGVLLPPETGGQGYNRRQIDCVLDVVRSGRYEPVELPWPPQVTPEWISKIRMYDWVVLDVGSVSAATGVVGFLHGEFKPSMRLLRIRESGAIAASAVEDLPLYSGFTVGYQKDILRWENSDDLVDGLTKRMASLHAERRRISTLDEALVYFRGAALRKEAIFISYAGADQQLARNLIDAVRGRFQRVFDYRDGESIRIGQPWIKEIFDQLAVSPIGIPLLSSAYVASGNCMHELREMVARRDTNQMQIFPIKLSRGDSFAFPAFLGDTQYAHLSNYASAEKLIDWIVANIP